MKIGVLGSGNVGGTLGRRWAQGGHVMVFGTRRPESGEIRALLSQAGPNARAASSTEAAAASDVVLVSTPWPATKEIVTSCGSLAGKIVVDATNPYCGDDAAAKAVAGQLAVELVFDARDAGPLTQARLLESLALLWILLTFARGYGREFAFQILRRNAS
jgi:predicted dinucleotide-binding enzyme